MFEYRAYAINVVDGDHSPAKEDRRAYFADWSAKKRVENQNRINAIKLAAGCLNCGYRDHPAALDFDHRDPTLKRFDIARTMTRSWAVIQAEIEKCDILCANCHRIKSWQTRWEHHVRIPRHTPKPRVKKERPPRKPPAFGEGNASAKLTEQDVLALRHLAAAESSLAWAEIGRRFGLTAQGARAVAIGRTWKHLPNAISDGPKPTGRRPKEVMPNVV